MKVNPPMQKGTKMRVIDPEVIDRDAVCRFLEANGIDPHWIAREPLVYDGRALRIRADYCPHTEDGKRILSGSRIGFLTIPVWYKVHREATPRRYGI